MFRGHKGRWLVWRSQKASCAAPKIEQYVFIEYYVVYNRIVCIIIIVCTNRMWCIHSTTHLLRIGWRWRPVAAIATHHPPLCFLPRSSTQWRCLLQAIVCQAWIRRYQKREWYRHLLGCVKKLQRRWRRCLTFRRLYAVAITQVEYIWNVKLCQRMWRRYRHSTARVHLMSPSDGHLDGTGSVVW